MQKKQERKRIEELAFQDWFKNLALSRMLPLKQVLFSDLSFHRNQYKHAQNYHFIEKENPGVEINPVFISSDLMKSDVPNVYASPGGSLLHTLGTLMKSLLSKKPGQKWILVSPHEDSPYLSKIKTSQISLTKYLNGLDKDVQMACAFSKLSYNVSTNFVQQTQAKLKNMTAEYEAVAAMIKEFNMTKQDQREKYIAKNNDLIKWKSTSSV